MYGGVLQTLESRHYPPAVFDGEPLHHEAVEGGRRVSRALHVHALLDVRLIGVRGTDPTFHAESLVFAVRYRSRRKRRQRFGENNPDGDDEMGGLEVSSCVHFGVGAVFIALQGFIRVTSMMRGSHRFFANVTDFAYLSCLGVILQPTGAANHNKHLV